MNNPQCKQCRYGEKGSPGMIKCHRLPPKAFPMQRSHPMAPDQTQIGTLTIFPELPESEWCGEFRVKIELQV